MKILSWQILGMNKYGPKAQEEVHKMMREYKEQQKKPGPKKIKSREQAIAIGLSKARKEGAKVPPEKK